MGTHKQSQSSLHSTWIFTVGVLVDVHATTKLALKAEHLLDKICFCQI